MILSTEKSVLMLLSTALGIRVSHYVFKQIPLKKYIVAPVSVNTWSIYCTAANLKPASQCSQWENINNKNHIHGTYKQGSVTVLPAHFIIGTRNGTLDNCKIADLRKHFCAKTP